MLLCIFSSTHNPIAINIFSPSIKQKSYLCVHDIQFAPWKHLQISLPEKGNGSRLWISAAEQVIPLPFFSACDTLMSRIFIFQISGDVFHTGCSSWDFWLHSVVVTLFLVYGEVNHECTHYHNCFSGIYDSKT